MRHIFLTLALFIISFTNLFANAFEMTIVAIEKRYDKTTMLLDNGSQWVYSDSDLFQEPHSWKAGDRVHIAYEHYSSGYFIKNISFQGCAPVKFKNSDTLDIKARAIQSICKSGKDSGHTITLDDGTIWHVGLWSSLWMDDWQAGDHVLVSMDDFPMGFAEHLMINLDKKFHDYKHRVSNVRAQWLNSPEIADILQDSNQRAAQNWQVTVVNLFQGSDSDFSFIELDNGTIWKTENHGCSAHLWKAGQKVLFNLDFKSKSKIELSTKYQSLYANLFNKDDQNLKPSTIQKIAKKKLMLSDGSVWILDKKTTGWQEGNRILTLPSDYPHPCRTHLLFNIDLPKEESPVTCIEGALIK